MLMKRDKVNALREAGQELLANVISESCMYSIASLQRHVTATLRAEYIARAVDVGADFSSAKVTEEKEQCGSPHVPVPRLKMLLRGLNRPAAEMECILASPLVLEALLTHPEAGLLRNKKGSLSFDCVETISWMCENLDLAIGAMADAQDSEPRVCCLALLKEHLVLARSSKSLADKKRKFSLRSLEIKPTPKREVSKLKKLALCDTCSRTFFGRGWKDDLAELLEKFRPDTWPRGLSVLGSDHSLNSVDGLSEFDMITAMSAMSSSVASSVPANDAPMVAASEPVISKTLLRDHSRSMSIGGISSANLLLAANPFDLEADEFLCASCGRISGPSLDPRPVPKEGFDTFESLMKVRPSEFARQLTVMDAALFAEIPLDDFRKKVWEKVREEDEFEMDEDVKPAEYFPGDKLRHLIGHINRFSYWVSFKGSQGVLLQSCRLTPTVFPPLLSAGRDGNYHGHKPETESPNAEVLCRHCPGMSEAEQLLERLCDYPWSASFGAERFSFAENYVGLGWLENQQNFQVALEPDRNDQQLWALPPNGSRTR
jgi:RasGEF domain